MIYKDFFRNFLIRTIPSFLTRKFSHDTIKIKNKTLRKYMTLKILGDLRAVTRFEAKNFTGFPRMAIVEQTIPLIPLRSKIPYSVIILGGVIVNLCSFVSNNLQLFQLAKCDDSAELKHFLEQESLRGVNERHLLGWTALQVAAVNGKAENVKILLAAGANIDAGDEFSNIYQMAVEKELNVLDVMLQREDEFNNEISTQVTYTGCTALHYAALKNDLEVVRVLLQAGADPTRQNSSGYTPLKYASDETVKKLLLTYTTQFLEIEKLKKIEKRRRFPLSDRLKQRIIGQEIAISNVAAAICRKENGWTDNQHPLVFLFLGSSGIGKTELGKQLADYLHEQRSDSLIRIDMSEYQEKHEVAKLIGAPPGYIGYNDGGQLTKKLRQCPNAIVLFDEVDKAHPDVLTVLLQLFDEGRLTDSKGNTIDCKDAVFVMTSNLAAEEIAKQAYNLRKQKTDSLTISKTEKFSKYDSEKKAGGNDEAKIMRDFKNKVIQPILKEHFRRDEFLGRINEIIYFLPFSTTELNQLVSKELNFWAEKALEKHEINLEWTPEIETLIAEGYDSHYGVRSIKYEVERSVVNKLAAAHEKGIITKGSTVKLFDKQAKDDDGNEFFVITLLVEKDGEVFEVE